MDTMLYVGEKPWSGLGAKYSESEPLSSTKEIAVKAGLDWKVNFTKMFTEFHNSVENFHAIFREDNNEVIGAVNKAFPSLVQNTDMFDVFESILGKAVNIETAASLSGCKKVFGCFKLNETYKVKDDDVDHYLVLLNEHLRADGKITIINTPIRVVCENTLSQALKNNAFKYRIQCTNDSSINNTLVDYIMGSIERSKMQLNKFADNMLKMKIDQSGIDTLMDELFPYMPEGEGITSQHIKANERTTIIRETFLKDCLGADNLANYKGTSYAVFNALTDYTQHYFKNAQDGVDLEKRMNRLPGMNSEADSPIKLVNKYFNIAKEIAV